MDLLRNWKEKTYYGKPDDLVFPGKNYVGSKNKKTIRSIFIRAISRVDIDTTGKDFVPYSLRHTYNSLMRDILPERVLRQFTGHKSEAVTGHYYQQKIRDKLGKIKSSKQLVSKVFDLSEN